jgi:hypothetical protein
LSIEWHLAQFALAKVKPLCCFGSICAYALVLKVRVVRVSATKYWAIWTL